MYQCQLSASILLWICVFSTTGCSFFSFGRDANSLTVKQITQNELGILREIAHDPYVYKLIQPGFEEKPLYISYVEQCGLKGSWKSRSSARQLLVGFQEVRLNAIQDLSSNLVRTQAEASLDNRPHQLLIYSSNLKGCVRDFVAWGSSDSVSQQLASLQSILERHDNNLPDSFAWISQSLEAAQSK